MGIAVSSTLGGFFIYGIIQNFKDIGYEVIINTLLLVVLVVFVGLILFNVLKLVKEKIKTKPADQRTDEKIKSNLCESLHAAIKHFNPEKLEQKSWVILFDLSNWFFSKNSKILDTDNPFNPYFIDEGIVKCVLYVSKQLVFIQIPQFTYHDDWKIFFNELASYRKELPIDSIILSVPVSILLNNADHKNYANYARDLKKQLADLSKAIWSTPPIYVALSEMEALLGFSAFTETMIENQEKSEQIFGWNNPDSRFDEDELKKAFDKISKTLKQWGMHGQLKLNDTGTGFALYAFHEEIHSMADHAITFFRHIFQIDFKGGIWRGFYFLGIKSEKPYFFHNFLNKVYQERHLVSPSEDAVKSELKKLVLFLLTVILIVLIASFLIRDYRQFRDQTIDLNTTLKSQVRHVIQLPESNISIPDSAIQILEQLNNAPDIVANNLWIDYDVQNDLTTIKNSVCTKALFRPVILQVSMKLQNLELPQKKKCLLETLGQGLQIMAGKPLSSIDQYQLTQQLPPSEASIAKNIWAYCKNDFYLPKSEYKHLAYYLRLGLGNLYSYWLYDSQKNVDQSPNQGNITVRFYQDYLEKLSNTHSNIHIILLDLQTLLSQLADVKDKPCPKNLKPSCQNDYSVLLKNVSENFETFQSHVLMNNLRKTIVRHQIVCESLDQKRLFSRDAFNHIWDKNGSITEDLKNIVEILQKTKQIYDQFLDALKINDFQNTDLKIWKDRQLEAETQLNDLFGKINSPQWEQKKLQQSLLYWLDQLHQHLREHMIKIIREKNFYGSALPQKKNDPIVNVSTVQQYKEASRNNTIQSLSPEQLLNQQQKFIQQMESIGVSLSDKEKRTMANDYKQMIFYWWQQLDNFDPITSILSVQTWPEFKNQVCQIKGMFIDEKQAPLNYILANVSIEKFQQLKLLYQDYQFDDDTLTKEKEIIHFTTIFLNPVFLKLLENAQRDFYEQVEMMHIGDSQIRMDQLQLFSQFIENCGIPQNQLHVSVKNLTKIESRCIDLFNANTEDHLQKRFDSFVNQWQFLFDQYPFIHWISTERTDRRYYPYPSETLNVSTASLKEMHHFFFDENIGLISIYPKYGIYFEKILTVAQLKLLKTCEQWQHFLFNLPNKSTKKHQIKLLLDTQTLKQNSKNEGAPFTKILIPKLFNDQSFSINDHNNTMTAHWEHDLVNEITIHAYHETQKRVVITEKGWISTSIQERIEPLTRQSKLIIKGGDLFLIAFTKKFSENACQNLLGKTKCKIQMDLPEFDRNSKKYMPITFLVEWDEVIPDIIYWP